MSDELTTMVGEEVSAYFIPGFMHGFNAGRGWESSGDKMDKRLGVLTITALNFHTEVAMPIAFTRVLYVPVPSNPSLPSPRGL
jgi:hypothetical protein